MSETFSKVEVIARRRRFATEQKLSVVNETLQPGVSISYVARHYGLSPNLVFQRRRLIGSLAADTVTRYLPRRGRSYVYSQWLLSHDTRELSGSNRHPPTSHGS